MTNDKMKLKSQNVYAIKAVHTLYYAILFAAHMCQLVDAFVKLLHTRFCV